jgi:hypothetical protein
VRDVSHDYGLDKNIEIVDSGAVTGRNFSIQLKATDRSFAASKSPLVSIAASTLKYMANRPEPVMIILYSDPDTEAYWVWRHQLSVSLSPDQESVTVHFNPEQKVATIDWQTIRSEVFSFLARPTVDSATVSRLERFGRYSIDLRKAAILRSGWHPRPDIANVPFHGFGEIEFEKPLKPGNVVNRGGGKFWNVDEAHPENTIVKPIQLRRVEDDSAITTMTSGKEKAVRSLIKRTLLGW